MILIAVGSTILEKVAVNSEKEFQRDKCYIYNKKVNQTTSEHFILPGNGLHNVKCTVLEQVKKKCILYRKEQGKYFIRKFGTYYNGLNKKV